MARASARYAIVDVGSNTIHLLVADSTGHALHPVVDESSRLRLAADVAQDGAFGDQKLALAVAATRGYVELARAAGARQIRLLGTQAVRTAANGDLLAQEVERATGLRLQVIEARLEAILGYLGTTLDHPDRSPRLIVDIGGGSTQLLLAAQSHTHFVGSYPLGTVALPTRHFTHEPPTVEERQELERLVQATLGDTRLEEGQPLPHYGILIGGTGRRLRRAGRLDKQARLLPAWAERMAAAAMTVPAEIMETFGAARAGDANIVRVGALALHAIMQAWDVPHFVISKFGIREGAILALARGERILDAD